MKKGYTINIEKETLENTDFRRVLYTSSRTQLVLMALKPGEDIGLETHPDNYQFFRIESGDGECLINETLYKISDGHALIVPAGAKHNITNTSETESLTMYTLYSPAHHQDGIVRATKEGAEANEADFDGMTTE